MTAYPELLNQFYEVLGIQRNHDYQSQYPIDAKHFFELIIKNKDEFIKLLMTTGKIGIIDEIEKRMKSLEEFRTDVISGNQHFQLRFEKLQNDILHLSLDMQKLSKKP